jgi:hypothetical protein
MNAAARVRREKVRIQAASMFEESKPTTRIASELRFLRSPSVSGDVNG